MILPGGVAGRMTGGIGFKVLEITGKNAGEVIDESPPFGKILRIPGEAHCIYHIDVLKPLSVDDEFRINKILKLYEERSDITAFGSERKKILEGLVGSYARALKEKTGKGLSADAEREYIEAAFVCSGDGLGPVSFLLPDDGLEEIMVNGIDTPIYVYHRRHGMLKTNLAFANESYFIEKANQILAEIGRRVDETHPRANGVLKNGDRVSIVMPPYSRSHSLDIRKFSAKPLTVLDLAGCGMLSIEAAGFLWLVMEAGGNVGIVGNTGAGKTTLLNALFRFVPYHQRVICVEETPEIQVPQEQCVRMISVDNLNLGLGDAIMDTLRLRPDRVIIGEVRRRCEAEALRESILSGQSLGTYFTYHAESAAFALQRLAEQGINGRDLCAIDLLVVCKRYNVRGKENAKRIVTEIVEVLKEIDPVSGLPKTRTLFAFDYDRNCLMIKTKEEKAGGRRWLSNEIVRRYLGSNGKDAMAEVKARAKSLESMPKGMTDAEFLKRITAGCAGPSRNP